MQETIVALATARGHAGIAVIRLSGPRAKIIAETLSHQPLTRPRYAYYRTFYDADQSAIDLGLILYFKAPASFTGEEVVEIQCHGGWIVSELLVTRLIALGARLARPGEFSERAFLNGKIDLVKAEAIADLITAQSRKTALAALRSLQGVFSEHIQQLAQQLVELRVYCEAALDFPDEELDLLESANIKTRVKTLQQVLDEILRSAMQGSRLRSGLTIAIIGAPNAGKSSLLNALSGEEHAIVTAIPGTTRDVLREQIVIDGLPIHICDTAGLRDTDDIIEQEGITRAYREMAKVDHILAVFDVTQFSAAAAEQLEAQVRAAGVTTKLTRVLNKIDLLNDMPAAITVAENNIITIALSAKQQHGIMLLRQHLFKLSGLQDDSDHLYSARERHVIALRACQKHLQQALSEFKQTGVELIAEELRLAHQALMQITGEFSADDLLGEIFSSFCIGK